MLVPLHAALPGGQAVTVVGVADSQVGDVFGLVQDAQAAGDGYGVDEFPTERAFLREVQAENGKVFKVVARGNASEEAVDPRPIAAFVILDSRFYRGQGTVADSYIVVRRDVRMRGVGSLCMRTVITLAQRLGYVGLYCDTFRDNTPMRRIMDRTGFRQVGLLPVGARMPDGALKQSVVYYRPLDQAGESTPDGALKQSVVYYRPLAQPGGSIQEHSGVGEGMLRSGGSSSSSLRSSNSGGSNRDSCEKCGVDSDDEFVAGCQLSLSPGRGKGGGLAVGDTQNPSRASSRGQGGDRGSNAGTGSTGIGGITSKAFPKHDSCPDFDDDGRTSP